MSKRFNPNVQISIIFLLLSLAFLTGCSQTSPGQVVDVTQSPIEEHDTTDASTQNIEVPDSNVNPATSSSTASSTSSEVEATTAIVPSDVKVFNLEADYLGMTPDRVYVNKSDKVRFVIHVKDNAYSGMRFVGKAFNETTVIAAGQDVTIDAVAETYFEVQGFKPGDRKLKAVTRVYVSD